MCNNTVKIIILKSLKIFKIGNTECIIIVISDLQTNIYYSNSRIRPCVSVSLVQCDAAVMVLKNEIISEDSFI
jgi:hypothetical protein